MDFSTFLPFELMEEIFSHLSDKDLLKCSEVSLKWREAANSDKLWRPICEKLSWKDSSALCDVKSNFFSPLYQFRMPQFSDRLTPVSDWKLCYCRQKYLLCNWYSGRYITLTLGDNIDVTFDLSFASTDPADRMFLPVMERVAPDLYEFNVMRIDGMPTKVSRLEENMEKYVSAACVAGHTIAYVYNDKLKMVNYQNGGFSVILEYELLRLANEMRMPLPKDSSYSRHYTYLNSNYLIVKHKYYYFQVWDRKTGDKLGFIEAPMPNSKITAFCLCDSYVHFALEESSSERYKIYEYNIAENSLTLFSTVSNRVEKILNNEYYLIAFTDKQIHSDTEFDGSEFNVLIYNVVSRKIENTCTLNEHLYTSLLGNQPYASVENNLLFYYHRERESVTVRLLPSCEIKTECKIHSHVLSLHYICQNIFCVVTTNDIELWDWEKRVKLYTFNVGYTWYLIHDKAHLILQGKRRDIYVIGFW